MLIISGILLELYIPLHKRDMQSDTTGWFKRDTFWVVAKQKPLKTAYPAYWTEKHK